MRDMAKHFTCGLCYVPQGSVRNFSRPFSRPSQRAAISIEIDTDGVLGLRPNADLLYSKTHYAPRKPLSHPPHHSHLHCLKFSVWILDTAGGFQSELGTEIARSEFKSRDLRASPRRLFRAT